MPAHLSPYPTSSTTHANRALLWVLSVLTLFGFVIGGLYQDARLRKHGIARSAMVVRNRQERSAHILTLRYCYGPDTFQAEYVEYHRRRVQALRAGDSATVRFWPTTPQQIQVEGR